MTTLTIPTYYKLTQEEFNKAKSLSKIQIECQECFKVFETVKRIFSQVIERGILL